MQVTPETKALFEQLALRPEFAQYIDAQWDSKIKVLKQNIVIEQIFRAQGAIEVLDAIRSLMSKS